MKSYAKVNVFLKVVGTRKNYHEILSRFILVDSLYDELEFVESKISLTKKPLIKSNIDIIGENIIAKSYKILANLGFIEILDEFFEKHFINLTKNIPLGAGLGGGSSNGAAFLKMVNEKLNLGISKADMIEISAKIGADLPFFISGYKSANVSGIGEIVEEFSEIPPKILVMSPKIHSDTTKIYSLFRENFIETIEPKFAKDLVKLSSKEILQTYQNYQLNDLLKPFLKLNPSFKLKKDEFLSGSGSSYFKLKDDFENLN